MYRILLHDEKFQALEIPMKENERLSLILDIQLYHSQKKVLYWRGTIIEGNEIYDICQQYHLNPAAEERFFPSREEATAWICQRQLKRTDICPNATAWLFFQLYIAKKNIEKKERAKEDFQYRCFSPKAHTDTLSTLDSVSTGALKKLATQYQISTGCLSRYITFGRRLDRMEELYPGTRRRILTGELGLSRMRLGELLSMPGEELKEMLDNPACKRLVLPKKYRQNNIQHGSRDHPEIQAIRTGIKEMPAYDPDAELNGLAYTVSAWVKTVIRVKNTANFPAATAGGKMHLHQALSKLLLEINALNTSLEEKCNDRIQ